MKESVLPSNQTIHRAFFIGALSIVLSLGCVWGAINLLSIGLQRSFGATKYSWILAHAHAMVFGFVGLFIMGFTYQFFPRWKGTNLWRPKVAILSLPLMLGGIALQTVAHLMVPAPAALSLAVVAAFLQVAAVIISLVVIFNTARQSAKSDFLDYFVYAAFGWFFVAALANAYIFKLFEFPANRQELLFNLATFNIPYRDIQLLGMAVMMILGVSLRFLPTLFEVQRPSRGWTHFVFWAINVSLLAGAASFIAGMATGNHWLLLIQWLSTVPLLAIAVGSVFQYGLFKSTRNKDQSLYFVRAAYAWFIVATLMLVLTPIYNFMIYPALTGSHTPFSHAFFGAYRHALTVGFIMMMIIGVSSKIVPLLSGANAGSAALLWPIFLLVNLGNLLRVTTEIATDFFPAAYTLMGVSGFIEVTGLILWAYMLVRAMRTQRTFIATADFNALRAVDAGTPQPGFK